MRHICSACAKHLRDTPGDGPFPGAVSHGLCTECAHHFLAQAGMPLDEFLDTFPQPVVAVAPDGLVGAANRAARALLRKSEDEIIGNRGGVVFECAYSHLPGGCGRTTHCEACTIRRTVMDTVQTGRPHLRVPVLLDQSAPGGPQRLSLLISTEKTAGVVILRVEQIAPAPQGGTARP